MSSPEALQQYAKLLRIRLGSARRTLTIVIAVFALSFGGTLFSNLSTESNNLARIFEYLFVMFFGLLVVSAWSRFAVIKGSIELVDELEHEARMHS